MQDDAHPLLGGSSSGAASGGSGGGTSTSTTGARQRTAAATTASAAGGGARAGAATSLAAPSPASSSDNGSRDSGSGSGGSDNNTSSGSGGGMLGRLLLLLHLVGKLVLSPLRKLAQLAFPPGPYDGLAAAAASDRAARDFCASFRAHYLTSAAAAAAAASSADGAAASSSAAPPPPPNPFSTAGYRATLSDLTSAGGGGGGSSSSSSSGRSPLLFVYLHAPHHPDCAAFCRDTLAGARMIRCLHDLGEARMASSAGGPPRGATVGMRCFGASVHSADGQHLAQSLGAVAFPFVGLVQVKSSGGGGGGGGGSSNGGGPNYSLEVHLRLQGRKLLRLPPDTLLAYLQTVVTHHGARAAEDEARRLRRDEAARLRREQDREYQEALAADRAREAERQSAWEHAERERRHRAETERRAREEKEKALAQARSLVGDEPPAGKTAEEATTRIRLTLPNGRRIERRFRADDPLAVVRAFLTVHLHEHGVDMAHFALSTSFPKRTYDDPTMTLREGGLVPQAVLMVQDLDA